MQIIKLEEDNVRIIRGALAHELTIDWSIRSLSELKKLIEFALRYKDLHIHEGANHLDIVDNNVGSLNLLIIEDHLLNS
jgi:hypothetical protein